jgi:aminopeptidase N
MNNKTRRRGKMKGILCWILACLAVTLFPLFVFPQDKDCSAYRQGCIEKEFKQYHRAFSGPDLTKKYDLTYTRFEWVVNPDTVLLIGAVTSYFKVVDTAFGVVQFELSSQLRVDSAIYHRQITIFTHTNDVIDIKLPSIVPYGATDSVTVFYHGSPSYTGLGSYAIDYHSNVPIIWTLSEPFGAKEWWPCKQSLNDKIDSIDVFITIPVQYKAASNGILVSEKPDTCWKTCHWKHRYPIAAYLVAIGVTNYSEYSIYAHYGNDSLLILNYIYPEDSARTRWQVDKTVEIMEMLMKHFGKYPFFKEKYGHAEFGRNGGMEHQTMGFMGRFEDWLITHELAHQWFGDQVTCYSWQDIWLNEGFASFAEELLYEDFYPKSDLVNWRRYVINNVTLGNGGSVYVYGNDTNDVNRVFDHRLSYDKGAMVLQMLRWILGDSIFYTGIRNYLNDSRLSYGYALTVDFRKHMEAASGKDLNDYFMDWIYREGYPSYSVYWSQSGKVVNVRIKQLQSHSSVDFFELPVPLLFKGAGKDTLLVFDNIEDNQQFVANIDFSADTVLFDPDLILLSNGNQVVKTDVKYLSPIDIYPSPGRRQIIIRFNTEDNKLSSVMLCDVLGRIIKVEDYGQKVFNTGNMIIFDTPGLRSGIYLLKVSLSDKEILRKVYKAD